MNDINCPYKDLLNKQGCWGYESYCPSEQRYSFPNCHGDHRGWVKSKSEQRDLFFTQGDFGYIRERKKEMMHICLPQHPDDSSLECVEHLRYCRGRNILIDFENLLTIEQPMRYKTDVLKHGQIGGHCLFNIKKLEKELDHKSPLQSWAPELENFVKFNFRPVDNQHCDIIIKQPIFLMKLDATVNMYHHFCDFMNLYLSQHMNNSFSSDVQILIWDMMPYRSNFGSMWKVFTKHPILDLAKFVGKKVCFQDIVFSYLPRMIFGMYYNMPLVDGCEKSGFFHAFVRQTVQRLGISQIPTGKIRVTLLSRNTTYRRILNEDKLIQALVRSPDYQVRKVNYNYQMSFSDQLFITHNTDIFIGIHGAGLTHLLFLPDWAVIFEIYNCEDDACYRDLARLRGVKYITWENKDKVKPEDEGHHPTLGAHAKFTNYDFDVEEFLRLMTIAKEHVIQHFFWKQLNKKWLQKHEEL